MAGVLSVFIGDGETGGVERGVRGEDIGGRVLLSRCGVLLGERRGDDCGDCCEFGGVGK
jgi:hypothetical protein